MPVHCRPESTRPDWQELDGPLGFASDYRTAGVADRRAAADVVEVGSGFFGLMVAERVHPERQYPEDRPVVAREYSRTAEPSDEPPDGHEPGQTEGRPGVAASSRSRNSAEIR